MSKPLFAVIVSGDTVSAVVDARKIRGIRGIMVPGVTSGDLLVQGALDSASGSFARLSDTRALGSSDLRFATGVGSRFVPWPAALAESIPPFLKVEILTAAGSLQADTRTLTILTRG